jgi:glycosyltransferase involved in cell wall biosynthesis
LRIVFITHYFPPLNSSGARRVNAFAKYLESWGHEITIITTRKTVRDGLLTEKIPPYLKLLEIDFLGRHKPTRITDATLEIKKSLVTPRSGLGVFLLNFKRSVMKFAGQLIDHRLVFALQFAFPWLSPTVKHALSSADIVISSSPPWPAHLAGKIIKRRFRKPWVADYRDQFSGNHILQGSFLSRPLEVWLDRWLIKSADYVVTISSPMQEYYSQFHSRVACIENGYEQEMFDQAINDQAIHKAEKNGDAFVLRYMGTITSDRIPGALFQALAKINETSDKPVIIEFYGDSTLLRKALLEMAPEAQHFVHFHPQLPYADAIRAMLTADALFFIETSKFSSQSARGVLTTKLFEYMAAKKPIIAEISAQTLAAKYIENSGLGVVISENSSDIYQGLLNLCEGRFSPVVDHSFIESLSRIIKSKELEQLLSKIVRS